MKKYILILAVLGAIGTGLYLFYPKGASDEQIDGMANEICQAIDGLDINNSKEVEKVVGKVGEISGKEENQEVTFEELASRSKKVCSENWEKFMTAYENL